MRVYPQPSEETELALKRLKDGGNIILDEVIAAIPGLGTAWRLANAWLGAPITLRKERAMEYLMLIKDHPEVFTQQILEDEVFQDGFLNLLEKYLRQRNEEKRNLLSKLLLTFGASNEKDEFDMEKIFSTIDLLSIEELLVFSAFVNGTVLNWWKTQTGYENAPVDYLRTHGTNHHQLSNLILVKQLGLARFSDENYTMQRLVSLVNLGLLYQGIMSGGIGSGGGTNTQFMISDYGQYFADGVGLAR